MTLLESWKSSLIEAKQTLDQFLSDPKQIEKCLNFTKVLVETYRSGGKFFICGNGGSHCDSYHFAEEFTGRYRKNRVPIGALALGESTHLSCVGNDFGFDHVFERQIQGLARPGDLLILISTSGNSKNQILACEAAKQIQMKTFGLLGREGGKLLPMVDHSIVIPGKTSDRIQEMHIKIIHSAVETFEREVFPDLYQ